MYQTSVPTLRYGHQRCQVHLQMWGLHLKSCTGTGAGSYLLSHKDAKQQKKVHSTPGHAVSLISHRVTCGQAFNPQPGAQTRGVTTGERRRPPTGTYRREWHWRAQERNSHDWGQAVLLSPNPDVRWPLSFREAPWLESMSASTTLALGRQSPGSSWPSYIPSTIGSRALLLPTEHVLVLCTPPAHGYSSPAASAAAAAAASSPLRPTTR